VKRCGTAGGRRGAIGSGTGAAGGNAAIYLCRCKSKARGAEAREHASPVCSLCTTKWRARALDHKDSRVRHERRDTRFENVLPSRTFLRTFEAVHSCMHM
jgi:hypothetical protein